MAQATISTTVTGLQGHPVSNVAPVTNQALVWNGTQWAPSSALLQTSGGTLTGPLILAADATTPLQATTLEQMQAADTVVTNIASGNIGRNLIHNPMFNVQQRGVGPWTTFAAYTADRYGTTGGGGDTISDSVVALADTDRAAIGDEAAQNAYQRVFTGSSAAGANSAFMQAIEAIRRISGKTIIVSFWARASTGTPRIGVAYQQSFGSGGSPSAAVAGPIGATAPLSGTWTRYSLTAALPSASGKTFGTTAGTDFTRIIFVTSDQPNTYGTGVGVQSGTVLLWGVQLEIAQTGQTQPTLLEKPDPRYDLSNCQRFFQVSAPLGSNGVPALTNPLVLQSSGGGVAPGYFGATMPFTTRMRTTPTFITWDTNGTGNAVSVNANTGVQNGQTFGSGGFGTTPWCAWVDATLAASYTTVTWLRCSWQASADF
jgi:hypothetical protein